MGMDLAVMNKSLGIKDTGQISPRKVIVWGEGDLLTQSLGLFLESNSWEVVRVLVSDGTDQLIRETKRLNPDVVILCRDLMYGEASLPLRLIQEHHRLRVLTVGLESNEVQVYSKQSIILEGVSDLLSIVETSNFSKCTLEKEVE